MLECDLFHVMMSLKLETLEVSIKSERESRVSLK